MKYNLEKFFNLSIDLLCIAGFDGYFKKINPAFEQVLGWKIQELLTKQFFDFIHPEDISKTYEEVEKLSNGVTTVFFENRYKCSDGLYKTLLWTAYPDVESNLIYAIARDITGQEKQGHSFEKIVEASPSATVVVKKGGEIFLVNKEAERLFGYSKKELTGSNISMLIPDYLKQKHNDHCNNFFKKPSARFMGMGRDLLGLKKDGKEFPIEIGLNPVKISGKMYVLCALVDLTKRKEYENTIKKEASLDPLTGIMNRRSFFDHFNHQLAIAKRNQEYLSLLMIDVDHFKSFNDTFGHQAGDEVLKKVAEILNNNKRSSDFIARYGGEEFCVLLSHTDKKHSIEAAERFREAVLQTKWEHKVVTVSIGISTYFYYSFIKFEEKDEISSIVEYADTALYFSKNNGRNKSTHYTDIYIT